MQKSQKIKLKLKVLQMTDEDQMKSTARKLKKMNGISSKYLTKLIIGNYWMTPSMILEGRYPPADIHPTRSDLT